VVAFAGGYLGWLLGACLGAGFPFGFGGDAKRPV